MRSARRYHSGGSRPGCRRQPEMYCELPPAVDLLFIYLPDVNRARVQQAGSFSRLI